MNNERQGTGIGNEGLAGKEGSGIFFKALWGMFLRDLRVLFREFHVFLARVGMQPLLFLFVFTFILPRMGGANIMASGGGDGFRDHFVAGADGRGHHVFRNCRRGVAAVVGVRHHARN